MVSAAGEGAASDQVPGKYEGGASVFHRKCATSDILRLLFDGEGRIVASVGGAGC